MTVISKILMEVFFVFFCIFVSILPVVIINCFTDQERIDEWQQRGNVWPPNCQPGKLLIYDTMIV